MRLIERLHGYEKLLLQVSILLINGKEFNGTITKIHRDFLTLSTTHIGVIDIKLASIVAVSPTTKQPVPPLNKTKKRRGR